MKKYKGCLITVQNGKFFWAKQEFTSLEAAQGAIDAAFVNLGKTVAK